MRPERILLVRTYAPVTHPSLCPPLGLMYIASAIRHSSGDAREIRILDMRPEAMSLGRVRRELEAFRPDLIGISSLSHEAGTLHDVARVGKEGNKECLVLAGGPHPSMFFDEVLQDRNVDHVIVGEGEQTITEFLSHFEDGGDPAKIPGLASRTEAGEITYEPRPPLSDLDRLPFPAWNLIDIDAYAASPNMNSMLKGKRYMAVLTSRGCPYGCAYCHNLFGRKFRSRSPESVFREMETLRNDFGVDEFHIVDDIFNLNEERAHAICDLMIENRLDASFAFPNGLRGDLMDQALIRKMVLAGCYSMTYAVETASPRLQKLLGKNMDLERLEQTIDWSFKAGVVTKGFFMLGFPTETVEEIRQTISFALRSKLLLAGFYCVVPFPRTRLFELARTECPDFSPSPKDCFYYSDDPYYTRKTGVDLSSFQRRANRAFYLNPRRLANLLVRIPRKRDLLMSLKPFLQLTFDKWRVR